METGLHYPFASSSFTTVFWGRQQVAAWLGNALVLINVVALRWVWLVLGRVTILVFNQSHPDLLSLAISAWVGTMSTGGSLGHR